MVMVIICEVLQREQGLMAGWAAWSPVRERDKLGVVTYNYQVINTST